MADDNIIPFPGIRPPQIRPVYDAAITARMFIHIVAVTDAVEGLPDDVRKKWGEMVALQIDPSKPQRYDRVTSDEHGLVWPLNFGGVETKVFVPWGAIQGLTVFQKPEMAEAVKV